MSERTQLDRIRDLLDGRLAPAEVDAVRSEIAADAALRADFEAFREVREFTSVEPPAAPSRVTADDVLRRGGARVTRLRPWVVAASLLAALVLGATVRLVAPRGEVVELSALRDPARGDVRPGAVPSRSPAPPEIPAALADFAPVRAGKPQWVGSLAEGRALAWAASKPIFAYVYHPTCPACSELDAKTFADAGVQADLAEFVPVKVDVTTLDEHDPLAKRIDAGWPYLAAIRVDDRTIHELAGRWELADVAPELHRAVDESRRLDPAQSAWDAVRQAAREVRRADELVAAGKPGEAIVALGRAERLAPASGVAIRASWVESTLGARAQTALADAAAGRADVGSLEHAASEFAGCPIGDDLAAVARAFRATGAFPRLSERGDRR